MRGHAGGAARAFPRRCARGRGSGPRRADLAGDRHRAEQSGSSRATWMPSRLPTGPAWPVPCWSGWLPPRLWPLPGESRWSRSTICMRTSTPASWPARRRFILASGWSSAAGTPACITAPARSTWSTSGARSTTQRVKRLTKLPRCCNSDFPAGRRSPDWPSEAIDKPTTFPVRCLHDDTSTSVSAD